MWIENEVFKEDLKYIVSRPYINWDKLAGSNIFVTGGTGLIGRYIINACLFYNHTHKNKITILTLVRNLERAKNIYHSQLKEDAEHLIFIQGSVEDLPDVEYPINYIVHCASPTSSAFFANKPVETILISVKGTMNILNLAAKKKISSMIYLSSMEVYGPVYKREKVSEDNPSYLNTMAPRSSYPEAKRLCETLCASYGSEYQVPVNCIRLTQTFGPGISYDDQRIFAMFIRSVLEKKNIILLTEGKTCRDYLYLADAATAILCVLTSNCQGEVFNAANEKTYCSIREMAELVSGNIAKGKIAVELQLGNIQKTKNFMPELFMDLDTTKLKQLGWEPYFNLTDMFNRTIKSL